MIEKGISRTITFTMRDSATGQPKTTLIAGDVTVKISKDGGAFAATTNSPVAIQDTGVNTGEFSIILTAAEMTADAIVIKATATGCIEVRSKIATEANYTATRAGYLTGAVALDSTVAKEATLTAMKGATFNGATDSLEALRDRGDTAWITATGFSTHSAADTWAVATRILTAGTNIVLAKGTGVTGFNDLSAAQVNTECDTALTDYDPPTRTEATADKDAIVTEVNANETKILFIEKWINNKLIEGPVGTWKLYDDDNVTVLKTWTWDTGTLTRSKAV